MDPLRLAVVVAISSRDLCRQSSQEVLVRSCDSVLALDSLDRKEGQLHVLRPKLFFFFVCVVLGSMCALISCGSSGIPSPPPAEELRVALLAIPIRGMFSR